MKQKNPSLLIRNSLRIIGIYSTQETMDKMKKILVVDDQFIQKPIQNEDLIKIITMKMEEKPSVGFEERWRL